MVRTQPKGGGHFMVTGHPLASASTIADIRSYPWPDPSDPGLTRGLRAKALALREETGCCLIANLPRCMIHEAKDMRGFEQWMVDMALDRPFAEYLLDTILDISIEMAGRMLSETGDIADVVYLQDDFAGQSGPLIPPSMYREIIKPRHARLIEVIKQHTSARILYHSCGAVGDFLEDFIEIGVDAVNPVQVSAAGMDTKVLKKRFHGRLAFWGTIDSQQALSQGTERDIEREVSRRIGDLASGGGYVLAIVHNIQDDVPPENVVAMFRSAQSPA
ncbi:MAG: uroporphyrinogen decarboxylase family protein [Bacillota bacterium]